MRSTGAATELVEAPVRSVVDPAIGSQQVTGAALVNPVNKIASALPSQLPAALAVAFLYFVAIPAFWVVIVVTSAVNVVLNALGLPLLPNVPDPPFGPTPPLMATPSAVADGQLGVERSCCPANESDGPTDRLCRARFGGERPRLA